MSTSTAKKPMSTQDLVFMILTFALPIGIMLIPTNQIFTPQLQIYMAITLFAILTFVLDNINQTAMAILLPLAYVVFAKAPAAAVFAPWTTYIPWFVIGGLFLARVMERTNLLRRIAYKSILLTGASYNGIIYGMALAGVALFLLIPGNTVFPLAALAYGLCMALNLKMGKETAGITMAAAIASLLPGWFIFNANWGLLTGLGKGSVAEYFKTHAPTNPLMAQAAAAGGQIDLTWIQYFTYGSIFIVFYLFMFWVITMMFKPAAPINAKDYFKSELEKLGKMSMDEKKVLVMSVMLFAFLLTTQFHKIEAGWGFVLFPLLLYFPGFNVAIPEDIKGVNYGMAIFTAACMGIGTTAGALGLGKVVGTTLLPLLQGMNVYAIFAVVFVMAFVLNFLMTPLAIWAAFTMPLTAIVMSFGINPAAFYMFFQIAIDSIILPYEYVLYLIFFSFGIVRLSDFVKFQAVKTVLTVAFLFAVALPFWKMIGFLMM